MNVKSVNFEGIFNFRFGTGEDENLIVNLTEFIDSKMYAGGDNRGDSDGRSSDDLNVLSFHQSCKIFAKLVSALATTQV